MATQVRHHAVVPGAEFFHEVGRGAIAARDQVPVRSRHEMYLLPRDGLGADVHEGLAAGMGNENWVQIRREVWVAGRGSLASRLSLPATGDREDADPHVEGSTGTRHEQVGADGRHVQRKT